MFGKGVARRGGAVLLTGRCQLKKTGQRSSERPTQGVISPGDFAELRQRTSGKRKERFRAFSRDSGGEVSCEVDRGAENRIYK